jgi:chemotaxis protein MotB
LRPDQVNDVRGFADQRLRNKEAPEDAENRRISVIVRYVEGAAAALPSSSPEPSHPQPEHH